MDRPIPLRPDPFAWREKERRSFHRALAAMFLAHGRRVQSHAVAKNFWQDDDIAGKICRAASSPLSTGAFPQIQSQSLLPQIAPDAASSKVLALGTLVSLDGVNTVRLPYVGGSGRPASTPFVGEGAPVPVVDLITSGAILGPAHKISIAAALSAELADGSGDMAAAIIGKALAAAAELSIDALLFSNTASTANSPAGLLYGVTPITGSASPGQTGLADDLALLAGAISANGVSVENLIIVTTASLATKARILAGPAFQEAIFSSSAIPAGTVIALAPAALAVGYAGTVETTISNAGTAHLDTAPTAIGTPGTPNVVAAPTVSAWQSDLLLVKIRARCAWCIQSDAVAYLTGADW
jgi:hypothetical protein